MDESKLRLPNTYPIVLLFLAFLCGESPNLFAFSFGDKVEANGLVYVRQTAGGQYSGTQASGTQGTVVGGPVVAQVLGAGPFYNWYNIDWPSAPDGWVAEAANGITQLTLVAGVTLTLYVHDGSANGPVLSGT